MGSINEKNRVRKSRDTSPPPINHIRRNTSTFSQVVFESFSLSCSSSEILDPFKIPVSWWVNPYLVSAWEYLCLILFLHLDSWTFPPSFLWIFLNLYFAPLSSKAYGNSLPCSCLRILTVLPCFFLRILHLYLLSTLEY